MENNALQKIAQALVTEDQSYSKSTFCTETPISITDIEVVIEGIGQLTFPIDRTTAQSLLEIASKARFGLREKTLLDEKVRDTYEIDPNKIKVKIHPDILDNLLKKIRHSLQLSDESKIIPHLHNMLIYEPGQFFDKHQDSEKLENMVATLVIILPSPPYWRRFNY